MQRASKGFMRPRVLGRSLALLLAVLAAIVSVPHVALAQVSGSLRGVMTDKDDGNPLPFGNVVVVGTKFGSVTREDGTFLIPNIPVGIYQVQATYMGYVSRTIDQVRIEAAKINDIDLAMKSTVAAQTEAIEVTGERALVEVDITSTQRRVTAEEIATAPVTTVADVLVQQAGVTFDDNEIHIRGGRSDETQYRIDGVVVKDLISGRSGGTELAATSVSEVNVITGGFNAEYGEALSGVIDVATREGSDRYRNYTSWKSDHYPLVGEVYRNFSRDEFNWRSEGPEPITTELLPRLGWDVPGSMTFFANLSGVLSDTHLPGGSSGDPTGAGGDPDDPARTLRSGYENSLFGQDNGYSSEFWSPRLSNDWRGFGKLTWKLGSKDKLNFSFTKNLSIDHGFDEAPIVRQDVTESTSYPWEWSRRLDHYYTYTRDTSIFSLNWSRLWSKNTTTQARLSRHVKVQRQDVFGRLWTEYEAPDEFAEPCDVDTDGDGVSDASSIADDCNIPFFVDNGDAERWQDRYSRSVTGALEVTRRVGTHHTLKSGWETSFETVQYVDIRFPTGAEARGLGQQYDIYRVHPVTGAAFMQDAFDFEGFKGNVGLRLDYWFPGEEADEAVSDTSRPVYDPIIEQRYLDDTFEFLGGRRVKVKVLPRVAVSHPVTDHTHLFLNYGQFSQRPSYFYVYSKIASTPNSRYPLLGNLALNPELAAQYEMGFRHEFSRTFSGDATFFYKDIYDYPTSVRFAQPGQGDGSIYINNDFARSRGFELQLKKRRNPFLSGTLAYSYSIATGKASSPNQSQVIQREEGTFAEIGIEEGFLWWNRPHKLSLSLDYKVAADMDVAKVPKVFGRKLPRDWYVNVYTLLRSGRAYTPEDRNQVPTGKKYSGNAPFNAVVDLRTEKGFSLFGSRRLALSIEGRNIFNWRYPTRVDPSTGEVPRIGEGQVQPYTDQPLHPDPAINEIRNDGAREAQQLTYSNPSWYSAPRSVWVGVGVDW